jgi:AraC-like DNA-binding protein
MPNPKTVEVLRVKYLSLANDLDERGRRRWAATEAMAIGHGGIVAVAATTGLSDRTLRSGIEESRSATPLVSSRQRRVGGGRKRLEHHDQTLQQVIECLIEPPERGDPQSPLRSPSAILIMEI